MSSIAWIPHMPTPSLDSSLEPRPVILVTTVDLGEGKTGTIEVFEGDDPHEVARQFCLSHGLPENIVEPLALHIWDNLEEEELEYSPSCSQAEEVTPIRHPDHKLTDTLENCNSIHPTISPPTAKKRGPSLLHEANATVAEVDSALRELNTSSHHHHHHQQQRSITDSKKIEEPDDNDDLPPPSPAVIPKTNDSAASHMDHHHPKTDPGSSDTRQSRQHPPLPPLIRPSSANSALGAEYYGSKPYPTLSAAAAGLGTIKSSHGSKHAEKGTSSSMTPRATADATAASQLADSIQSLAIAPAADRLYADFFRKQQLLHEQTRIKEIEAKLQTQQVYCTPVSRALASHRTAEGYSSYGERLYVEGKLDMAKREEEARRVKEAQEAAELAEATFRPRISKMAQNLKSGRHPSGSSTSSSASHSGTGYDTSLMLPSWERLHSRPAISRKEVRAEMIKKERDEAELKECTFHPTIDARSHALTMERRSASQRALSLHSRLYHEAKHRQGKLEIEQQRLPDQATFAPRINKRSSSVRLGELSSSAEGETDSAAQHSVVERLLSRGERYRQRINAAREASAAPIDKSGRRLFRPKTYRPPKFSRNPGNAPIGEYLYASAVDSSSKAAKMVEEANRQAHEAASVTYVNTTSEAMMERLKKERLSAVFAYLHAGQMASSKSAAGASWPPPPQQQQHAVDRSDILDLFAVVMDHPFMNTIDPEVRADVEHAAHLLAHPHSSEPLGAFTTETGKTATTGHATSSGDSTSMSSSNASTSAAVVAAVESLSRDPVNQSAEKQSTFAGGSTGPLPAPCGIVDEARFLSLMQEVLKRSRGVTRQYLMPLPSYRKKWEEPSFHPAVDPTSLQLAARSRPGSIPAHELLYRAATEIEEKKLQLKKLREAAAMMECSFKPALVAAPKAKEGKALKLAGKPKPGLEEGIAKTREQEKEVEELFLVEQLRKQQQEHRRERLLARKRSSNKESAQQSSMLMPDGPDRIATASGASKDVAASVTASSSSSPDAPPFVPSLVLLTQTADQPHESGPRSIDVGLVAASSSVSRGLATALTVLPSLTPASPLYYQQHDVPNNAPPPAVHSSFESASASSTLSNGFPTGESLEDGIDAIERQINNAMIRLNMSSDVLMSTATKDRKDDEGCIDGNVDSNAMGATDDIAADADAAVWSSHALSVDEERCDALVQPRLLPAQALATRLDASLDFQALFGSGTPLGDQVPRAIVVQATPPLSDMAATPSSSTAMVTACEERMMSCASLYNPVEHGGELTPEHGETALLKHHQPSFDEDTNEYSESDIDDDDDDAVQYELCLSE